MQDILLYREEAGKFHSVGCVGLYRYTAWLMKGIAIAERGVGVSISGSGKAERGIEGACV